MHISDGFLPASVCLAGYGITGGLTWYSLSRIKRQYQQPHSQIPKAALLTAAFFLASLIHIRVLFTSVHLILNGVMGVILGYYAFPAVLVGLFFQAVMFNHGGLSTLGVNAVIMGLPALAAHYIFQFSSKIIKQKKELWRKIAVFIAASGGLILSILIFSLISIIFLPTDLDASTEKTAIYTLVIAHSFLIPIEGIFAVMLVSFLQRVKPELLDSHYLE